VKKNEFIKQIRQKYKMSQKKFAEYLEVSKSLIEKVEMGKIPATPENKYVKAVCALEGLDNEIFKFDEITEEILKKYELTKFSKAFRKFLYFYYGDFWNEDIRKSINDGIKITMYKYLELGYAPLETDFIPYDIFEAQAISAISKFCLKIKRIDNIKIHNNFTQNENDIYNFLQIFIILWINKYKPSCFNSSNLYFEVINNKYKKIMQIFAQSSNKEIGEDYIWSIYGLKIDLIKKDLADLEDIGLPLTIENIKKLKKQKELEKIQNEIIPVPTDPKDKQICELLQYAPPAFKDKIIEKLLKFKDEVEDI